VTPPPRARRADRIEHVAGHLIPHAALLARLLLKQLPDEIPRTEAGLLNTLTDAPRRITELAELEGLAQPTMTLLVQRLEQRGWVSRERHAGDGRVVLVTVTDAGRAKLEEFRAHVAAALHPHMEAMSDDQIAALETATVTLGSLIDALQGGSDNRLDEDRAA
jgi:DNA-binding MarR family transcriptional regulator